MLRISLSAAVTALLAASISATSCRRHNKSEPEAAPLRVEVATATSDSIIMRYSFTTHLRSNYDAVIQPRVDGYLERIAYRSGMPVRRGDLLFTIESNLLNTSLLAAQAALSSAEAEALEAKNNYDRAIPLARLNAISDSQLDQYTAAYNSSVASVRSARQQVTSARLQVSYATIYSPIDGIVAASKAHEGDYVGPSTQFSALTTVSNIDSLKADLSIPTSLYLEKAGNRSTYENRDLLSDISLTLADGSIYPYKGIYDYTAQQISTSSGTVTLVVKFPNPDYRLKGGEYGRVEVGLGQRERVVLVPQMAIEQVQGIESVWVVKPDNTVEQRTIQTGETVGRNWIVKSGVSEGETVVLTGKDKLHSGMRITPQKSE
ncbi:MAG: efflux RND transporter periplasmic adaptor subunit [Alistipes sp.]|nr:efflux RND transporter periplasmic adaptor subunit [Alistipes sp.]